MGNSAKTVRLLNGEARKIARDASDCIADLEKDDFRAREVAPWLSAAAIRAGHPHIATMLARALAGFDARHPGGNRPV